MTIHILVFAFVLLTPFIGNTYLLLLHALFVPFIMLHWFLHNKTCAIVIFEKLTREKLTGCKIKTSDCLSGKIIEPVYSFNDIYSDYATPIYWSTFILWIIGIIKLYKNFASGKIKSINDIVKI